MLKQRTLTAMQAVTLTITIGLIGWMMVATVRNAQKNSGLQLNWALMIAVVVIGLILGSVVLLTNWLTRHKTSWLVATFIGLTALKLPLLGLFKIQPTSDFWNYHALAAFSAQGLTWKQLFVNGDIGNYVIFPHAINIASLFSLGAAFWGSTFIISQLINITCSLLDMFLLYWLVARWLSRSLGIVAALIFYWIPAFWLYGSLLNGAEPAFLTFLLIAMLALTNMVQPLVTATPRDHWVNFSIALLASFAANMVRPIVAIWLIALIFLGIEVWLRGRGARQPRPVKLYRLFVVSLASLMLVAPTIYSWLYGFEVAPNRVSTAYSMATGTDPKTGGAYDAALMGVVTHELKVEQVPTVAYNKIATKMSQATQKQLHELARTGQWGSFLQQKMQNFMAEDYGYDWVLYNLSPQRSQRANNHWWQWSRGFWNWLALIYFELLMGAALLSSGLGIYLLWSKRNHYLTQYFFYAALLLAGFTTGSLLVEVQGRYHVILYLPLIFLSICGLATLKSHAWRSTQATESNAHTV